MIPQKTREGQIIPLNFQRHTVRTVLIDGVPWFAAKDVCDILGIKNPTDALKDFPENERNTLASNEGIHEGPGNPNVNIINEPGLYRLVFQSRKPEAEQFKTWVFATVLPQIRRTGYYIPVDAAPDESLLTAAITRYFETRRPDKQADIEVGRCLTLLKGAKRHGEFLPCLSAMGVSRSNAARYMKRYRRTVNPEPLPYTGARKLPAFIFKPLTAIRQLPLFRDSLSMSAV
jgi:prophage antirepressor-like protein